VTDKNDDLPVDPAPEPEVVPTKKTHILCDFYGRDEYVLRPVPEGWLFDRRVTFKRLQNVPDGQMGYRLVEVPVNLEHVDEDEHGLWRYRVM